MKSIHKYIGVLTVCAAVLTLPACTDTWDEHYEGTGDSQLAGTETLWQHIKSNPKLSRFATLAEKTPYYKDQLHPLHKSDGTPFTFKDMLMGSQLLTVWAPENDAIENYEMWLGYTETNPYLVQQQVLSNSMSLYRQVATGTAIDTITMLNGKKMQFDKSQPAMQNIKLDEKNIAASNGTLHTLTTRIPFEYNIYEYLKNSTDERISRFHDYVIGTDTTYFFENGSIEGTPDENGNPTYVDSAYVTTNTLFMGSKRFPTNTNTDKYLSYEESFGAPIQAEDSTFIFTIPTDAAWQAAYQKLEKYYNYAPVYEDHEKKNNNVKGVYREVTNVDSLKAANIDMDIISPLCYNLKIQPNAAGYQRRMTMDEFLANPDQAKYILNTFGDTLRTDAAWQQSQLFQGERVKMSNGVGLIVNEWPIPMKLYRPDLIIETSPYNIFNSEASNGSTQFIGFSNEGASKWIDGYGKVSKNNFLYVKPKTPSEKAKFQFKLIGTDGDNRESDVMSGKYDIYLVLVPNLYVMSNDSIIINPNDLANCGFAAVSGDTIPLKHNIEAVVYYNEGNAKGTDAKSKKMSIEYDGTKVDTICIAQDFEFPVTYKNLLHSYPYIELTSTSTSAERKKGFSNDYCIDRIILKSKED